MKDWGTAGPAEDAGEFPRRIGIMADGHGDLERTRSSIALFRRLKADGLFHLGDACDFLKCKTMLPMARLRILRQGIHDLRNAPGGFPGGGGGTG